MPGGAFGAGPAGAPIGIFAAAALSFCGEPGTCTGCSRAERKGVVKSDPARTEIESLLRRWQEAIAAGDAAAAARLRTDDYSLTLPDGTVLNGDLASEIGRAHV